MATYQLQWPTTNPKRLQPQFVRLAEAESAIGNGAGNPDYRVRRTEEDGPEEAPPSSADPPAAAAAAPKGGADTVGAEGAAGGAAGGRPERQLSSADRRWVGDSF